MKKLFCILILGIIFSGCVPAFSQTTPTMRQVAGAGTSITKLPSASTATVAASDTVMVFKSSAWKKTTVSAIVTGGEAVTSVSATSPLSSSGGATPTITITSPLPIANGGTNSTVLNTWLLTGNSGTVDGTNFIGTTDNIPFNIRVNNQKAGRIDHLLGNTFFGNLSGNSIISGIYNTAIGAYSLNQNTLGENNVAIGYQSMYANTTGQHNTAIGVNSVLLNTNGAFNTGVGRNALDFNTIGNYNTALGYGADVSVNNLTNATAIGANTIVSSSNSLILGNGANVGIGTSSPTSQLHVSKNQDAGTQLLLTNNSSGVNAITALTLSNETEEGSIVFTGTNYTYPNTFVITTGATGGIFIEDTSAANILFATNNTDRMVIDSIGNVGIGTGTVIPTARLHVVNTNTAQPTFKAIGSGTVSVGYNGAVTIADGTQGNGKVFTSDANGVGTWAAPVTSATAWQLLGNSGTVAGTNFIGTTDSIDVVYKTNNIERMRILANGGNVGIGTGTVTPVARLHINSTGNVAPLQIDSTGVELFGISPAGKILAGCTGTGITNLYIGRNAGQRYPETGVFQQLNTAIGYQTLYQDSSLGANTAIGAYALWDTLDYNACCNTAVGAVSQRYNKTGIGNTSLGDASLENNISGSRNVAVGNGALGISTTGQQNTVVGTSACDGGTPSYATIIGYQSGKNSSGTFNTIVGAYTGYLLTSGSANCLVGNDAGGKLTTQSGCVFVGNSAGYRMVSPNYLVIDNQDRTTEAATLGKALIVGTFGTNPIDQNLTVNATITTQDSLDTRKEESVIDSAGVINLPAGASGWGDIYLFTNAGVYSTYANFRFDADEVVAIITDGGNVVTAAPADNQLGIYDAGTNVAIKNNIGTSGIGMTIKIKINY